MFMKLVRYGNPGKEKPGLIDADGILRDLSGVVPDIGPAQLAPKSLAKLARVKPASLPAVRGKPRLGSPFSGASKFVGGNDNVMLPKGSKKTDWEVELGIVIGTRARNVTKKDALAHVAGYCVVNDVSERHWQLERGPTWDKGKGFDTFGPIGPWLVTADEVGNPGRLDMWLDVNGQSRQRGNTKTMIFDCATLVAYVSGIFTLNPGDIITTGTPPGVGTGMKPPQFLKAGDVVTLGIQGLGEQRQLIVKYA
jgi:2-keto-4-pentenoate hydratase/2-oxohepta-3-ene-1,7-dioic acid hydratase in catechol pathway